MGDNDAAMRDIAAALVKLSALQGGNGQNHIPPVAGVGDSVTVVATGAQVPNRTFMAETRYPLAVRLLMQSCQNLASGYIIQTSTSVEFHVFRSHMESGFDHLKALMLNQCQHEPEEMAKLEQN